MKRIILPLHFSDDVNDGWIFDNRHTNPLSGNNLIQGTAPIQNAMPLGNYGVVERYTIDVENTTNARKTITYTLQTGSHVIITYKSGNEQWDRKIKIGETISEDDTEDYINSLKKRTIFEFEIEPHSSKKLIIEIILPNADAGGFQHQLQILN